MKELIGVQYLRGLAALGVVLFHVIPKILGKNVESSYGVAFLAAGVDLFFVISGYLIWMTTLRPVASPGEWWKARLIRIVPLYWLALLATLAIRGLEGAAMPTFQEVWRAFAFVPARDSRTGDFTPFLSTGWTLNYEFFFYAMMALALLMHSLRLRLIFMVGVFLGLVLMRSFADPLNPIHVRMTSPILFEFLFGIGVALVVRRLAVLECRIFLGCGLILLAIAFLVLVSPKLFYSSVPRVATFGVPSSVLLLGVVLAEPALQRFPLNFLKLMGDSSYSLYLIHPLVIMPAMSLGYVALNLGTAGQACVAIVMCVVAGYASYRFIEVPALRMGRSWLIKPRVPTYLPSAAEGSLQSSNPGASRVSS